MLDPVEECRMKKLEHEVRELREKIRAMQDRIDLIWTYHDRFGPIKQKDEPYSPF